MTTSCLHDQSVQYSVIQFNSIYYIFYTVLCFVFYIALLRMNKSFIGFQIDLFLMRKSERLEGSF